MRAIDAEPLERQAKECAENEWDQKVAPISWAHAEESFLRRIEDAPTLEVVPAEQYARLQAEKAALEALIRGEWVDSAAVLSAMKIDFKTGMHMFELSRTVEWNPAPLNGQKVETRFRLRKERWDDCGGADQ